MGQVLNNCDGRLCSDNKSDQYLNERPILDGFQDEDLFIELERALGIHDYFFVEIAQHLRSVSKFGALSKAKAVEAFKKAGLIRSKESCDLYSKFLITFEKIQANNRIINLNKLLTTILLLSRDYKEDKITLLFGIYAIGDEQTGVMKRASVRQMLDHICFSVIYAIPNLAYHNVLPSFGVSTEKCEKIMDIKLEMQKKVYNDKQNLFKVIMGQHQILNLEEFKISFQKQKLKCILSTHMIRSRLSPIISDCQSRIIVKCKRHNRIYQKDTFCRKEVNHLEACNEDLSTAQFTPYENRVTFLQDELKFQEEKKRVRFANLHISTEESDNNPLQTDSSMPNTPDISQSLIKSQDLLNLLAINKQQLYKTSKALHPLAYRKQPSLTYESVIDIPAVLLAKASIMKEQLPFIDMNSTNNSISLNINESALL